MNNSPYLKSELYTYNSQRAYDGSAGAAAFLLGGIGTGNVSLGACGELRDWEIFNHPGKGVRLPYSFFAIWTKQEGIDPVVKVLESRLQPPHIQPCGYSGFELGGLPRLDSSVMKGEYPFVKVDFKDKDLPVDVDLEAFTPFIPLNADDSGIPGAILRYKVRNPSDKPVMVAIAGSLSNAMGFDPKNPYDNSKAIDGVKNEYIDDVSFRGIFYTSPGLPSIDMRFGSLALMTSNPNITSKVNWMEGGWTDGIQDFWDDFCDDGKLELKSLYEAEGNRLVNLKVKVGSLSIYETIEPGEEQIFEFILTWHFPNRLKGWYKAEDNQTIRNYYCIRFKDAWLAGKYLFDNMARLEKYSRDFKQAFYGSTLPDYVLEAAANNITVLRSTTCFRIEDGTFLGWEGCLNDTGSCEGNCTHVWNYAQTVAFLFPELEQSMRKIEFGLETDETGKMAFRTHQVFGEKKHDFFPATDGQMGTIIRLYREWKLSGNNSLLLDLWPKASKALDFAFEYWDSDRDFVLDAQQHNTYDIEFYGPNSLTNSLFYAALKAGAQMASYIGDSEHQNKYNQAFLKGSARMDKLLWGGEYYIQYLEYPDRYKYQYGNGCLSDQLFGQLLAHIAGLGYVLPQDHVKQAIYSVYKYNFRVGFENHNNINRAYAINDEKGLLLCSWPKGGRPRLPFVYADEVWTGIEYQVAAHLIYEGFVDEGLTIVKAVRERHDGHRRNPWNEVECGNHYVRSMASWAVIIALSGFKYDMVNSRMSFKPAINENNFSTFWSTGKAWGTYVQELNSETGKMECKVNVLYGNLDGIQLN